MPVEAAAAFALYVTFGLAVPGGLWLRALRGRAGPLVVDLALGLGVGIALEMAAYAIARVAGVPIAVVVWPIATLALFVAVPALRRWWRSPAPDMPGWLTAAFVLVFCVALGYWARTYFAIHSLAATHVPYVDLAYQLALVGELRHHVPPVVPYVAGEPLAYHWLYHLHAAAATWATGIEPQVLLYRLDQLPSTLGVIVLTAAAAMRLTSRPLLALVAVLLTLFSTVARPLGWVGLPVMDSWPLESIWLSPTHGLGLLFMAALVFLMVDRHWRERLRPPELALLLLLLVAAGGTKASVLPLVASGLAAAGFAQVVALRRLPAATLQVLGCVAVAFAVDELAVLQGAAGGLRFGIDAVLRFNAPLVAGGVGTTGTDRTVVIGATLVLAAALWLFQWAGVVGLLRLASTFASGPNAFLGGTGLAALGAVCLLLYPGLSEWYFLRGATEVFALATVAGLAALWPAPWPGRGAMAAGAILIAVGLGVIAAIVVRDVGTTEAPAARSAARFAIASIGPVLALAAVALAAGAAAWWRLRRWWPRAVLVVPIVVLMSAGLPGSAELLLASPATPATADVLEADAVTAARWLRGNSSPDDLVATNLHCRDATAPDAPCDARHFWVSAYTERRVLIEGWAYTEHAFAESVRTGVGDRVVPFWDPARLAANNAAFRAPSEAGLRALRTAYGVDWLFADVEAADAAGLAREADLRFRAGRWAVYALR